MCIPHHILFKYLTKKNELIHAFIGTTFHFNLGYSYLFGYDKIMNLNFLMIRDNLFIPNHACMRLNSSFIICKWDNVYLICFVAF